MPDAKPNHGPKLAIDPQPRTDLMVPPMVVTPKKEGIGSTSGEEKKTRDVQNYFAGLDFSAAK